MTVQRQYEDWNWRQEYNEFIDRLQRNRICSICRKHFKSAKAVKKHKKSAHAY